MKKTETAWAWVYSDYRVGVIYPSIGSSKTSALNWANKKGVGSLGFPIKITISYEVPRRKK